MPPTFPKFAYVKKFLRKAISVLLWAAQRMLQVRTPVDILIGRINSSPLLQIPVDLLQMSACSYRPLYHDLVIIRPPLGEDESAYTSGFILSYLLNIRTSAISDLRGWNLWNSLRHMFACAILQECQSQLLTIKLESMV